MVSRDSGVRLANNPAGPATKTTPTRTIKTIVNARMNCLKRSPKYIPTISGRLAPSLRKDKKPARKSCVAPAKILPKTIQRNEAEPNLAPRIAPKIGPNPAIFRN